MARCFQDCQKEDWTGGHKLNCEMGLLQRAWQSPARVAGDDVDPIAKIALLLNPNARNKVPNLWNNTFGAVKPCTNQKLLEVAEMEFFLGRLHS